MKPFFNFQAASKNSIGKFLFKFREFLGKIFKWDEDLDLLPIPGCKEKSLSDRLSAEDYQRQQPIQTSQMKNPIADPKLIYFFEDESLFEISNKTIHALIHLCWLPEKGNKKPARIGIYIKSRGLLSDLYMLSIKPFRYWIIYPNWLRQIEQGWNKYFK